MALLDLVVLLGRLRSPAQLTAALSVVFALATLTSANYCNTDGSEIANKAGIIGIVLSASGQPTERR